MNEDMIEEIENVPEEGRYPDEVEQASEAFTKGLKIFKIIIKNTKSRKSLVRVLSAVAEFPLGEKMPRLLDDNEKRLFGIFQELVQNKSTVLTHFLHERLKKGEAKDGNEQNEG